MMGFKSAWTSMIGLMLALGACAEQNDGREWEPIAESASALISDAGPIVDPNLAALPEIVFGDVIANAGYSYQVGSGGRFSYIGSYHWDTCPANYSLVGRSFEENGFWLCARSDLASRTFLVGDVEAHYGYYYMVSSFDVHELPSEHWNTCWSGSVYIGTHFHANGFWVCMYP